MKKIVILGAGIGGLSAGWFLKKKFGHHIDLSILEKTDRVGGWIQTIREGKTLFEAGPRGFRPKGKGEATLSLIRQIGLEKELIAASSDAKKRYIVSQGKLHPFGPRFLLQQNLFRAILKDLLTPASKQKDETIAHFIERRFCKKIAEKVMDPLTKGIYGGDMRTLSMKSSFPTIWQLEQRHRSILLGLLANRKSSPLPSLYSFKNGMETLTQTLALELKQEIRLGQTMTHLEEMDADCIISTLPTHALAPLIGIKDPFTYTSLSLVHLGWNKKILPFKGFGFLVPTIEKGEILGMTWDSEIFPRSEDTQLCVMIGQLADEKLILEKAFKSLKLYLNLESPPDEIQVTFAPNAIPQYTLGHEERVREFKKALPSHVQAIGTSFSGPGINDAIHTAQSLAEAGLFCKIKKR